MNNEREYTAPYVRNEANPLHVVGKFRVVEGDQMAKHSKVFWEINTWYYTTAH